MTDRWGIHLPRVLEASDGLADWDPPKGGDVGLLLRDTSLTKLTTHARRGQTTSTGATRIIRTNGDRARSSALKLGEERPRRGRRVLAIADPLRRDIGPVTL